MISKNRIPAIMIELNIRIAEVVDETAEAIKEGAQERVPVLTGALRDGIHVEDDGRHKKRVMGGNEVAWYGHLVEYGTVKMAPRPFLVPAEEAERANAQTRGQLAIRGL